MYMLFDNTSKSVSCLYHFRASKSESEKKRKRTRESLKQELVAVRRSQGYAAAEKKMFFKSIRLCSVEAGEVIGDIETIMGMETHLQTVTCAAQTELYYLTGKNYERLITRKNPNTVDILRKLVVRKLESRVRSKQGSQIPLLKHIHFKLTQERKPQIKVIPPLRVSKELPEKDKLFNHLLSAFVQNKAELIDPYVPGAIYYREMMREKARIRDSVRRHRIERGEMMKRSQKQQKKPRTIIALRNDLQRQMEQQKEFEYKWLLEELRAEEKLKLVQELHRYKPLPEIGESPESIPQEQEPPVRLTTPERLAAEKLAAAEANGETAKQYGVFEMPILRERHVAGVNGQDVAKETNTQDRATSEEEVMEVVADEEQNDNNPENNDAAESLGGKGRVSFPNKALETMSNPETRHPRSNMTRRGAESAHPLIPPDLGEDHQSTVLVTEILSPHVKSVYRGSQPSALSSYNFGLGSLFTGSEESEKMSTVSPRGRSRLKLNYENPEYRDWETSDKTLAYLEERIKNFNVSERKQWTPVKLQKLARFEKGVSILSYLPLHFLSCLFYFRVSLALHNPIYDRKSMIFLQRRLFSNMVNHRW